MSFSRLDLSDLSVFSHLLWKSLVQPAFDISQITSCLRSNLNQNQAFEEEFTLRKCWNFICHLSNNFNVFFSNVQVSRLLGFQFPTIESVHSDKEIKTNFKPDFLPWLWPTLQLVIRFGLSRVRFVEQLTVNLKFPQNQHHLQSNEYIFFYKFILHPAHNYWSTCGAENIQIMRAQWWLF